MNEFKNARLKLTGWYILISFLLLLTFNIFAISAERRAFNRIQEVVSNRTERPKLTALLEERINRFEGNFLETLLLFDIVMLFGASLASYILSGVTLKPIEKMVKAQQEFAADASHELRTPLATIAMEIEALERSEKKIPTDVKKVFASIKEEILRMKGLVEGLLSVVREETTFSQKTRQSFDLNDLVYSVTSKLTNTAKKKFISVETDLDKSSTIWGNKEQIEQVITILVDNAIKYTQDKGKITLKTSKDQEIASVTIKDTGVGISEKDLPFIFDRFYRAEHHPSPKGIGLGLAIAKKIVEEHEGKIMVESKLGKGSKFTVQLPSV